MMEQTLIDQDPLKYSFGKEFKNGCWEKQALNLSQLKYFTRIPGTLGRI